MNYFEISFGLSRFTNKIYNGEYKLNIFSQFSLPEELEKLKEYYKKMYNNDPSPLFFILMAANGLVEQVLTKSGITWKHAYAMGDGSCFKYVQTELNEQELTKKLLPLLNPLSIYIKDVWTVKANVMLTPNAPLPDFSNTEKRIKDNHQS